MMEKPKGVLGMISGKVRDNFMNPMAGGLSSQSEPAMTPPGMGPVPWQDDPNVAPPQGRFSGFFGNLDQNLQSPSKVIGLGLLNQIHPALPYAGLLGMGMNWGRK